MATNAPNMALPETRLIELTPVIELHQPVLNEPIPQPIQPLDPFCGLSFRAKAPHLSQNSTAGQFWSHELYHGPNGKHVQVLYSNNKHQSEDIAQKFLGEKVLGFDLEWDWRRNLGSEVRLCDRIGLIQIACEDKIALFHIGLHVGGTAADLLAPSLCTIIESPDITKTGVNIMAADMSRFRKWFGLEPQGVFELSHLHNLVAFGASEPLECSTKLVKLSTQVETHLGLPLSKDEVRTSNWSRRLTEEQKKYAAADAYAGFMLYHCMNAKRMAMQPQPPCPVHADRYEKTGKYEPVVLQLNDTETVTAHEFFGVQTQTNGSTPSKSGARRRRTSQKEQPVQQPAVELLGPELSSQLLIRLKTHRTATALERRCAPYLIARDSVLHDISQKCPRSEDDLLQIQNVGPKKSSEYGPAWLSIVRDFLTSAGIPEWPSKSSLAASNPDNSNPGNSALPEPMPTPSDTSAGAAALPVAPDGVQQPPATLRTGLSFTLESTNLSDSSQSIEFGIDAQFLVGSSESSPQPRTPSPSTLKRKCEDMNGTLETQSQRAMKD